MGEESKLRPRSRTYEIVEDTPVDVEPPMTPERAEALAIADQFVSPMGLK